jgi:hypothetical protein
MSTMDVLPSSPSLALLIITSASFIVYVFIISMYRLYFHPIAHFPGPKLAGLTRWYEFYYELVKKGQMTFHIQELHKKYGNKEVAHSKHISSSWSIR